MRSPALWAVICTGVLDTAMKLSEEGSLRPSGNLSGVSVCAVDLATLFSFIEERCS